VDTKDKKQYKEIKTRLNCIARSSQRTLCSIVNFPLLIQGIKNALTEALSKHLVWIPDAGNDYSGALHCPKMDGCGL
jgi:hypothetical protein